MLLAQKYKPTLLKVLKFTVVRKIRTVSGTSIVETVVAMTILLTILNLSLVQINQVNSTLNPFAVYKAYLATNVVLEEKDLLIENQDEYEVEGFLVQKKLVLNEDRTVQLTLSVYNAAGKLQYSRNLILSYDIRL